MSDPNPPPIPRILPRGHHKLSDDVVKQSQQMRMLESMTSVCAEKGYAATSVADVIARAGVSRKAFYKHYENKEDCFLAAYDVGLERLNERIVASVTAAAPDVTAVLRATLSAYLDALAAEPDFARILAIEALAGGPAARKRRDDGFERFIELYRMLLEQIRAQDPKLPDTREDVLVAAIGAVAELIRRTVSLHGPEGLPAIKEIAIEITSTLLFGAQDTQR